MVMPKFDGAMCQSLMKRGGLSVVKTKLVKVQNLIVQMNALNYQERNMIGVKPVLNTTFYIIYLFIM